MQRIQRARTERIQVRHETGRSQPTIIIYSADWCGACRAAKKYMDGEGIEYIERNVDEPRWQEEMYSKAGRGGIPPIDYAPIFSTAGAVDMANLSGGGLRQGHR